MRLRLLTETREKRDRLNKGYSDQTKRNNSRKKTKGGEREGKRKYLARSFFWPAIKSGSALWFQNVWWKRKSAGQEREAAGNQLALAFGGGGLYVGLGGDAAVKLGPRRPARSLGKKKQSEKNRGHCSPPGVNAGQGHLVCRTRTGEHQSGGLRPKRERKTWPRSARNKKSLLSGRKAEGCLKTYS